MKSSYALLSGVLFGLVALFQGLRAIAGWPVQIGAFNVPVWFSWIVVIVAGSLALWCHTVRPP